MQRLTSIRFLIPALTLGILLGTAGLFFADTYHDTHERIRDDVIQRIERRLYLIQNTAERLVGSELQLQLQQFISAFVAEKDMHTLVVVDASDKVIAANHLGLLNSRWQDTGLHLDQSLIDKARRQRAIQTDAHRHDRDARHADGEHVGGYASLCPPSSTAALRPTDCGFIGYVVNTSSHYAASDDLLLHLGIELLLGLLLVSTVILASLHVLITRPTQRVTAALQQFAVGDRRIRIPIGRKDEIGHLAQTLNAFLDWITEDEQALRDQQQRLSTLFETVVDAIITIDSHGIIQNVNPATEAMFGYDSGELLGRNISILMPRDIAARHDGFLQRYRESGEKNIIGIRREVQVRTKRHRLFTAELTVSEMQIKGERYFTGVMRDISERMRMMQEMEDVNAQLVDQEEHLRAVFDAVTDAIITIDSDGIIQDANPATEALFGYTYDDLLGQDVTLLMPDHLAEAHRAGLQRYQESGEKKLIGQGASEMEAMHRDGSTIPVAVSLAEMHIKGERFFIGLIRDITEQVNLREIMEQLNEHLLDANLSLQQSATTDGLTGLANRRHFDDTLAKEIARVSRDGQPLSLLLLDVDYFKRYNDHYGHQQGDDCLRNISAILVKTFQRENDLTARYGGEEFAVILPSTDRSGAETMAELLREAIQALAMPHATSEASDVISASIGITTYLSGSGVKPGPEQLVKAADDALYAAKAGGRNRACFQDFDSPTDQATTN